MNAKDHKIKVAGSGLAYCPACEGWESELEETCQSRCARRIHSDDMMDRFGALPGCSHLPHAQKDAPINLTDKQALLIIENTNKRLYAEIDSLRNEKADLGMKLCHARDELQPLRQRLLDAERERDEAKDRYYSAGRDHMRMQKDAEYEPKLSAAQSQVQGAIKIIEKKDADLTALRKELADAKELMQIHELEKTLTMEQCFEYRDLLQKAVNPKLEDAKNSSYFIFGATAEQRRAAYLKVLDL